MLWLNSCPRCSTGAVRAERDVDGRFLLCLICGWTLYARDYGQRRPRIVTRAAPTGGIMPDGRAAA